MEAPSTPERDGHRRVVRVLEMLDAQPFVDADVVFAGGTRLALDYGEYRLSKDVDFLTSNRRGYAALRSLVRERGVGALFHDRSDLELPRAARIDQYGIRFPAVLGGVSIKIEIVAEGRIELGPGAAPPYGNVPWCSVLDSYAEKVLANSDRWADDAYLSRDLIDLAALRRSEGPIPLEAWQKARRAYGLAAPRDLERSASRFLERSQHQARCFERLEVRGEETLLASVPALRDEAVAEQAREVPG